jgi:hypothetical protein
VDCHGARNCVVFIGYVGALVEKQIVPRAQEIAGKILLHCIHVMTTSMHAKIWVNLTHTPLVR